MLSRKVKMSQNSSLLTAYGGVIIARISCVYNGRIYNY